MRHDVYPASAHSRLNNETKLAVFSLSDHDDVVCFRHVLNILDRVVALIFVIFIVVIIVLVIIIMFGGTFQLIINVVNIDILTKVMFRNTNGFNEGAV